MTTYDVIFYLFALVTLLSAFFVVTNRNIVHSAFYLLFTFFGVAGIYVMLGADFVAVVQLIVYVGGILILLLFGVMLTNKSGTIHALPASIVLGLFAGALAAAVLNTNWKVVASPETSSSTASLGNMLINEYTLIFELLGIVLLIALIGAASMARR